MNVVKAQQTVQRSRHLGEHSFLFPFLRLPLRCFITVLVLTEGSDERRLTQLHWLYLHRLHPPYTGSVSAYSQHWRTCFKTPWWIKVVIGQKTSVDWTTWSIWFYGSYRARAVFPIAVNAARIRKLVKSFCRRLCALLMPTLETMNDGHHPVATVPLDLRTINRKRCGSPEYAVPQRSQLEQRHLPVARSRTVGVDVDTSALDPNRGAPASDTCVTRKRPADKNSLKLPFRKRQFLVETEAQPAQVYSAETNRKTPAEPESVRATDLTAGNSWLRDGGESRTGAASLTPRTCQNTGASEDRIHFSHLHPVNYGKHWFFFIFIYITFDNTVTRWDHLYLKSCVLPYPNHQQVP